VGDWGRVSGPGAADVALVRGILLVLVALGVAGLIAELVLLEHTESVWQWVPLVLLGLALIGTVLVATRPGPYTFRLFRGIMLLCIAAGLLGLYLHYDGNVEFELESDPSARGLELVWRALRGATPTLAPAALAQLGVLGLLFTFRHPAARRSGQEHEPET
jgi:hypothetical protein